MDNTKFRVDIEVIHNAWCRENGYPVRWYRPQAGRPKLQASVNQVTHSLKRHTTGFKLKATGVKPNS